MIRPDHLMSRGFGPGIFPQAQIPLPGSPGALRLGILESKSILDHPVIVIQYLAGARKSFETKKIARVARGDCARRPALGRREQTLPQRGGKPGGPSAAVDQTR